jgi:DNA-binding XRE family transcriptional regulator
MHQEKLEKRSINLERAPMTEAAREIDRLLEELRAWVEEGRGRKALVARALGTSKQTVWTWLKGESRPNWERGMKLQAFLKAHNPRPATIREQLTGLLRQQPFVPFTVTTQDGRSYAIEAVGGMSVGRHACTVVDADGNFVQLPFEGIRGVSLLEAPQVG